MTHGFSLPSAAVVYGFPRTADFSAFSTCMKCRSLCVMPVLLIQCSDGGKDHSPPFLTCNDLSSCACADHQSTIGSAGPDSETWYLQPRNEVSKVRKIFPIQSAPAEAHNRRRSTFRPRLSWVAAAATAAASKRTRARVTKKKPEDGH